MGILTKKEDEANVQLLRWSRQMRNGIEIDGVQLLAEQIGEEAAELMQGAAAKYFVLPAMTTLCGKSCVTYGIGVLQNGIMSRCIPDISEDFNLIKSLAVRCSEEGLEPEHLMDIVEDVLI